MFTQFYDMHSGGYAKHGFEKLYVELPEDEAIAYFEDVYGESPFDVACDCCGSNYSVSEYDSLEEATKYHRRGEDLEQYLSRPEIQVVYSPNVR